MIQDIHAHTYYSFCGEDKPETIVEAAIAGGVELFGICDHNYGISNARKTVYKAQDDAFLNDCGGTLIRYFDHLQLIKEKYADQIRVLCGIEVATLPRNERTVLPETADISFFDYCLLESVDSPDSVTGGDLFRYAERCGCPVGLAHTDMFGYIERIGEDPYRYFKRMAEQGIFWEMNVSYDSIHHYREHAYVLRFFADREQQEIIREAGMRLSVGFDGHRVRDYRPDRVVKACQKITDMGIQLAFN
ncbi:MAG: PHP domain-containing protein [Ruminococcaceae bacterium]|nr:PHP domain-containing protein [Oscillospiraceae bacterium]